MLCVRSRSIPHVVRGQQNYWRVSSGLSHAEWVCMVGILAAGAYIVGRKGMGPTQQVNGSKFRLTVHSGVPSLRTLVAVP